MSLKLNKTVNMSVKCVNDRAAASVEGISKEREADLIRSLQQIRQDMNARGMKASSTHALEISEKCAAELRLMAKEIWQCIQRAHKSCGSKESEDLDAIFGSLLKGERKKLESMQEIMASSILKQLQNSSLTNLNLISESYDNLIAQYQAEVAMYRDELKQKSNNQLEKLKSYFLKNKLIAGIVLLVIVISVLAPVIEFLSKLVTIGLGILSGS